MSFCKALGLAGFAAVCLLSDATGSAHAQCVFLSCATEWSGGKIFVLGALPGYTESRASGINDFGQVVGRSENGADIQATEWSAGKILDLGPGLAFGINDFGQVVGSGTGGATEWSGGSAVSLGSLPGSWEGIPHGINDSGDVVGVSLFNGGVAYATEWSGGSIINLGGLPGSTSSDAWAINGAGQIVGTSDVGGIAYPTEWSGGSVFRLSIGGFAYGICTALGFWDSGLSPTPPLRWAEAVSDGIALG